MLEEMENELEKDILSYLSFPELMVAALCSKTWRDTIMGDKDFQKKVFDQDKNSQEKYYKILLNAARGNPLDLEKIRRLLYLGVNFNKRDTRGWTMSSTGEFYAPSLLCFAASIKLANKQDKELVRLLLNYKANVTNGDLLYIDWGIFYPDNQRNKFSENPSSYVADPTIMALLYLTRFENACLESQPPQREMSTITSFGFLDEAHKVNSVFTDEYLELLKSTPVGRPFEGVQENLNTSTRNKIIDTAEFKQLNQIFFRRRFLGKIWKVLLFQIFSMICLLTGIYKPGQRDNWIENTMIVGLISLALLTGVPRRENDSKEKKAHLGVPLKKLPTTEESKSYPLKAAGLFFQSATLKDKINQSLDEKEIYFNPRPGPLSGDK